MRDETVVRAIFRIFGNEGEPLPDVTALLGIEPDTHTRIGDLIVGGGRAAPRETWSIENFERVADDDCAEGAERCLDRVLERLERVDAADKLRRSGLLAMAEIKVSGFCFDLRNSNIWHPPARLRRVADLGVPLGEDFYLRTDE